MSAPIVFFDVAGRNTGALRRFYAGVFGWEADNGGGFRVSVASPLEGSFREDPPEQRLYLGVEDVAAALNEVVRFGGAVDQGRFEVPGAAVLGLFRDPEGNPMGLVEMEAGKPKVP